jgi:Fe2+ transport system protein B
MIGAFFPSKASLVLLSIYVTGILLALQQALMLNMHHYLISRHSGLSIKQN